MSTKGCPSRRCLILLYLFQSSGDINLKGSQGTRTSEVLCMKSRPTQPPNAFSMSILTVCSLLILDDMKSSSNCFQVTFCGVKKNNLAKQQAITFIYQKATSQSIFHYCTVSEITHVFEARIELQTSLCVEFKGHDLNLASHKNSSFKG